MTCYETGDWNEWLQIRKKLGASPPDSKLCFSCKQKDAVHFEVAIYPKDQLCEECYWKYYPDAA
jgi:hypothetical protein